MPTFVAHICPEPFDSTVWYGKRLVVIDTPSQATAVQVIRVTRSIDLDRFEDEYGEGGYDTKALLVALEAALLAAGIAVTSLKLAEAVHF